MSSISSGTTTTTALVYTADTTGNLVLQTGSTPTTAVTIDTSQRVGITATPSSWGTSNYSVLEFPNSNALYSRQIATNNNIMGMTVNAYDTGGTSFVYKQTGAASWFYAQNNGFYWNQAASGSSGSAISWTTAMTLDTSGNLAIGVTPSGWASPFKAVQLNTQGSIMATTGSMQLGNNIYYNGSNYLFIGSGYANRYYQASGAHTWTVSTASGTAGGTITETLAMTLDVSGNLIVGGTTSLNSGNAGISVYNSSYPQIVTRNTSASSGNLWNIGQTSGSAFVIDNQSSVGVSLSNGATSWSAFSDVRLKNITGTYSQPLTDIAQIKVIKFTWKSDSKNTAQVGVDASTVQTVVPEAISESQVIENDTTEYLMVRYTELIPLMISSIQELSAKVTALEAKVA